MASGALLPGADRQAQVAQLAAPDDRRVHAAANSVRPEQPLQIVSIGHCAAIQSYQDIALQEARGRGRSAFGDLDDEQAALLTARQLLGLRRQGHRLRADAEVATWHLAVLANGFGELRRERPGNGHRWAAEAEA